jgi:hypothetical protein
MMTSKYSAAFKLTALLMVLSLAQVYVLAGSTRAITTIPSVTPLANPEKAKLPQPPQAVMGKLVTRGNRPVSVNGNNMTSGATILSGATIETGDAVGATINLGPLGTIDIAPNSKVTIEFSNGQIKVTIIQGCAVVRNKKGTYAEIYTDKGLATHNDPNQKQAAVLDICYPSGAPAPIVNQGAAANAGAGAGAAAAGGGLPPAALAAIILGGGAAIALPAALHRGGNPSSARP